MDPAPHPRGAFDRRLQLLTGKGGVGKSSLVAALALEAARAGHRPLVVELSDRGSLPMLLGYRGATDGGPVDVGGGVWALALDPEHALVDYVRSHVHVESIARRICRNDALLRFTRAAPGVTEVLALHRLRSLLGEHERRDRPRFSPILVDLDATGHALMFLGLPRMLLGLVDRGPLARLVRSLSAILTDPSLTCLHLVTLPGELPVHETVELYRDLSEHHPVALGALFVNRVPRAPAAGADRERLRAALRWAEASKRGEARQSLALALETAEEHARLRQRLQALAVHVPLPQVELPELGARGVGVDVGDVGAFGRAELSRLGALAARWSAASGASG